jgi:hypothetical protein
MLKKMEGADCDTGHYLVIGKIKGKAICTERGRAGNPDGETYVKILDKEQVKVEY